MVQTKAKKAAAKPQLILSEKSTSPTEKNAPVSRPRQVTYPVLSFILFVVACIIYFFVGNLFMQMAVRENFNEIRYTEKPQPTGPVVAVVDGQNIHLSEIKDYAKSIPQLAELPFEVLYPQVLETVVDARVLKTAADRAKIAQRLDVRQALQLAHDQIVAQAYLEGELKRLATEERLKELYAEELKNFKPAEEVRAKHILVKTEKEARDILIQLRAGASFAMAAEKYSLDKSSPDGDLGYFTEDMMIPEFGKAVFALKKGQISEPVKTPFGWHIILLEDRRLSEAPKFDDIKPELTDTLMKQNVSKVLANERARFKVRIKKPKI